MDRRLSLLFAIASFLYTVEFPLQHVTNTDNSRDRSLGGGMHSTTGWDQRSASMRRQEFVTIFIIDDSLFSSYT